MTDLAELTARMRAFTEARDWSRFHDLKSLTLALTGEVGEVAELVQWLPVSSAHGALDERLSLDPPTDRGAPGDLRRGGRGGARA